MAGKKPDQITSGQHIIVAGLLIQIGFFGVFMITTAIFHIRIRKVPSVKSTDPSIPWLKHMRVLYAASTLIMIRSVMRVIEYVQGNDGYILRHEGFLYVFDGCLMLAVMVLYNVIHPSELTELNRGRVWAADHGMALGGK